MTNTNDNMTQDPIASQQGSDGSSTEVSPEALLRASSAVEKRMGQPQQGEMPFAVVLGEALTELPKDLYIPPRALEVFLEAFEGPLDLLLYLIRRQNLDILDIDVAVITEQYMKISRRPSTMPTLSAILAVSLMSP